MPPAAPSRATLRAPALASVTTADRLLRAARLPERTGAKDALLGLMLRMPSKVERECLIAGICLEWAAGACLQEAALILTLPAIACMMMTNVIQRKNDAHSENPESTVCICIGFGEGLKPPASVTLIQCALLRLFILSRKVLEQTDYIGRLLFLVSLPATHLRQTARSPLGVTVMRGKRR